VAQFERTSCWRHVMPCGVLKNSMITYGLISCQAYLLLVGWPTKKTCTNLYIASPDLELDQLEYQMVSILIALEKVQSSRLIASFADPEHVCTSKHFVLIKVGNNCESKQECTKTQSTHRSGDHPRCMESRVRNPKCSDSKTYVRARVSLAAKTLFCSSLCF